jgi:hypothetical protein
LSRNGKVFSFISSKKAIIFKKEQLAFWNKWYRSVMRLPSMTSLLFWITRPDSAFWHNTTELKTRHHLPNLTNNSANRNMRVNRAKIWDNSQQNRAFIKYTTEQKITCHNGSKTKAGNAIQFYRASKARNPPCKNNQIGEHNRKSVFFSWTTNSVTKRCEVCYSGQRLRLLYDLLILLLDFPKSINL